MENNISIQEYYKIIFYSNQPQNKLNTLVTLLKVIRGNIMECQKKY